MRSLAERSKRLFSAITFSLALHGSFFVFVFLFGSSTTIRIVEPVKSQVVAAQVALQNFCGTLPIQILKSVTGQLLLIVSLRFYCNIGVKITFISLTFISKLIKLINY